MEGYYEETGRGGAGLTGADYERMKDLPPVPEEGAHTLEEMWANIAYFLKAVVPVAEKANVRLALHPNNPPFPLSRGSQQIMATLDGWKRLIEIVDQTAPAFVLVSSWGSGFSSTRLSSPENFGGSYCLLSRDQFRRLMLLLQSADQQDLWDRKPPGMRPPAQRCRRSAGGSQPRQ
jgi:hypothetical protein